MACCDWRSASLTRLKRLFSCTRNLPRHSSRTRAPRRAASRAASRYADRLSAISAPPWLTGLWYEPGEPRSETGLTLRHLHLAEECEADRDLALAVVESDL